jgi:hypothetical protein
MSREEMVRRIRRNLTPNQIADFLEELNQDWSAIGVFPDRINWLIGFPGYVEAMQLAGRDIAIALGFTAGTRPRYALDFEYTWRNPLSAGLIDTPRLLALYAACRTIRAQIPNGFNNAFRPTVEELDSVITTLDAETRRRNLGEEAERMCNAANNRLAGLLIDASLSLLDR